MDPTNNTPAAPNPAPVAPGPTAPEPTPVNPAPVNPVPPSPAPVNPEPAAPAPAAPTGPAPVAAPVNTDIANAALNPPVNPVVAPGATPVAQPGAVNTNGTMSMNQMFQPQPATPANVFDETTAISVPEGPKPPDPVEEELKAPLKAAQPVPGSIGSAVSMPPADGSQPQTNGVNEQMMANGINPMAANANTPAGKKPNFLDNLVAKTKMSKSTLILLSVVAGLVIIALIVILIMVATGAF